MHVHVYVCNVHVYMCNVHVYMCNCCFVVDLTAFISEVMYVCTCVIMLFCGSQYRF